MVSKLLLLFVAFLTGGCASVNCYLGTQDILPKLNLRAVFDSVAKDICQNRCVPKTVFVSDFLDIETYMPEREGILMSEIMRGSLSEVCCYQIVQGEFSKHFKLSKSGLIALTRNPKEIRLKEIPYTEAVVGTYSISENKLFIFVRQINLRTGKIKKFITREISYSCVGNQVVGTGVIERIKVWERSR